MRVLQTPLRASLLVSWFGACALVLYCVIGVWHWNDKREARALGFGIGADFGDCTGMTVTTVHQQQISAHRETSQALILSPTLHLFC
jgi:hypothetical protein